MHFNSFPYLPIGVQTLVFEILIVALTVVLAVSATSPTTTALTITGEMS